MPPDGFTTWRRGVTYTVRAEMLRPLPPGVEFRISATVRRKIESRETFTGYGDLYRKCQAILHGRTAQLTCSDPAAALSTWTEWHAWWAGALTKTYPDAANIDVASASITMAGVYGEARAGEREPDVGELLQSGGAPGESPQRSAEMYGDYDFSEGTDVTLSYGEYVQSETVISEPIVARAEKLAHSYAEGPIEILEREWFLIAESKLVVVMIYFRTRS